MSARDDRFQQLKLVFRACPDAIKMAPIESESGQRPWRYDIAGSDGNVGALQPFSAAP